MAVGAGIEGFDHSCSAFDWSPEARKKSQAWFSYVQAFRREHNIPRRPLKNEEVSWIDEEFRELLDHEPAEL